MDHDHISMLVYLGFSLLTWDENIDHIILHSLSQLFSVIPNKIFPIERRSLALLLLNRYQYANGSYLVLAKRNVTSTVL